MRQIRKRKTMPVQTESGPPLRAKQGILVDAAEKEVHLTGINWFGMETETQAPHGLWLRNWQEFLDIIRDSGFNTIRLPYSNDVLDPAIAPVGGVDYSKNPDLQGVQKLDLLDRIIEGAGARGLAIILDRHRPTQQGQSELWYTDHVSEERWIADWVTLAQRYLGNTAVIGADLHNEPHGRATWGDDNHDTDWRLAAERAGNAILAVNPDWLIFVEGVDKCKDERGVDDWYWWGGNLMGAKQFPVRLSNPEKLVYSAHDYGIEVTDQRWFHEPDFPQNLPAIWEKHWAYLALGGHAPVLIGEFGGRLGEDERPEHDADRRTRQASWMRTLVDYLHQHRINYTYWALNPDSADTGGVLQDDWKTINQAKRAILSTWQWKRFVPSVEEPTRRTGVPLQTTQGMLAREEVHLTGINWFGMETETQAPHGLWARNWQDLLDSIVKAGFNTIRLPYSNDVLDPSIAPVGGIDYSKNSDLQGVQKLDLMDRIIEGAAQRGLKIILDRHRPTQHGQSELWYIPDDPQMTEGRWIADWITLAERYQGNATVIGADLHNEPHGGATWGDGNQATDWRLAAERAGNAILEVNPDWLIFVQGIEHYQGDTYWWGGNLMGAKQFPVRLLRPEKLVYSAHEYGPGVHQQPWFDDPAFPQNLEEVWKKHWGYLPLEVRVPVLLGEFGGRSVGEDKEGIWQRALMNYLRKRRVEYTYWALNPNAADTGGVLQDDWRTVNKGKHALLATYQWTMLDGSTRGY